MQQGEKWACLQPVQPVELTDHAMRSRADWREEQQHTPGHDWGCEAPVLSWLELLWSPRLSQGLAVEQLKLDCGNDSFKIALQVFLKIHLLFFFFFSQFNSCIWFTRSHRYTDRFYTCMCLNAKCVTGARRSWKSCWNHGSLVYTDAFTNLKGAFVCVTSIICFWVLCCVAVGAFSPAHLRWIITETLLLFPNALEAGSLNCCLVGHCFQTSKSLLWK